MRLCAISGTLFRLSLKCYWGNSLSRDVKLSLPEKKQHEIFVIRTALKVHWTLRYITFSFYVFLSCAWAGACVCVLVNGIGTFQWAYKIQTFLHFFRRRRESHIKVSEREIFMLQRQMNFNWVTHLFLAFLENENFLVFFSYNKPKFSRVGGKSSWKCINSYEFM